MVLKIQKDQLNFSFSLKSSVGIGAKSLFKLISSCSRC